MHAKLVLDWRDSQESFGPKHQLQKETALKKCDESMDVANPAIMTAKPWWRQRATAIAFLIVACGTAYWLGSHVSPGALPNEGLVVKEADLDIGDVWEAKDYSRDITVFNSTGRDLKITSFDTSCSCLAVKPRAINVPARGEQTVELRLDLRYAKGDGHVRAFRVHFVPRISDTNFAQAGWAIHGNVRRAIRVAPPKLLFADSFIDGQSRPSPKLTAKVSGFLPLTHLQIHCDLSLVKVNVLRHDPASNEFDLEVIPQNTTVAGAYKSNIEIVPVAVGGRALAPASILVEWNVANSVEFLPSVVLFGAVNVGDQREEVLLLRSRAGEKYRITAASCPSTDVTIEENPGPDKTYTIHCRSSGVGPRTTALTFSILREGRDTIENATVPVSYFGVSDTK